MPDRLRQPAPIASESTHVVRDRHLRQRTLEPLLATPLRTGELLAAKVISAAVPGVVLTICCFVAYVVLIAIFAEPRVWTALLTARSLGLVFLLGPLAALLGLQLAVCASSRVLR